MGIFLWVMCLFQLQVHLLNRISWNVTVISAVLSAALFIYQESMVVIVCLLSELFHVLQRSGHQKSCDNFYEDKQPNIMIIWNTVFCHCALSLSTVTAAGYLFHFAAFCVKSQVYRLRFICAPLPQLPAALEPLGRRKAMVNSEVGSTPGAQAAIPC